MSGLSEQQIRDGIAADEEGLRYWRQAAVEAAEASETLSAWSWKGLSVRRQKALGVAQLALPDRQREALETVKRIKSRMARWQAMLAEREAEAPA